MDLENKIRGQLKGPILVLGASGFIGANLLRRCLSSRSDVVGTTFSGDSWRLKGIPSSNISYINLQDKISVRSVIKKVQPQTIFDCSSFGAYSFEQDIDRIHLTNYLSFIHLMEFMQENDFAAYIHAGSSSEYGLNASAPEESSNLIPNSHYALSKAAVSQAISYYGKIRNIPVVNLRLYSVYGPYEDSSRLIPVLCENSLKGRLPTLAGPQVSRDFIFVLDAIEAFVDAAIKMSTPIYGESFNIGTGISTTLLSLSSLAKQAFGISEEPQFRQEVGRMWDVDNWYANPEKAKLFLGWTARTSLYDGLISTRDWWKTFLESANFSSLTKKQQLRPHKTSLSAIVACYKDAEAIPIMYKRLITIFEKLNLDYQIIFVNDASPDNSIEIIREISSLDPHAIGITHSRNFGSQAAFKSGMELATKEACVLLDGDLQDPPELIDDFIREWRSGADVVYGRRIKREMPFFLEIFYKSFYKIFSAMSEVPIPKNAGDFSLMDQKVVYWILQCKEKDAFLRGLRAYVGFKQVGVDYIRPKRTFGVSTNNWLKNIGWAKKGIFSFSRTPLHILTASGLITFILTILLSILVIFIKLINNSSVPRGVTFLGLLIMFFGSLSVLGIGLLGEYIGKIIEETKSRPSFIRQNLIKMGEIIPVENLDGKINC